MSVVEQTLEALHEQLAQLYREGGFEKRQIDHIWATIERIEKSQ